MQGKKPTATTKLETIAYQDHSLYGSNYRRENQYSAVTSERISAMCMGLQLSGRALYVQGPGFNSIAQQKGKKSPRNYL